MQFIENIRKKLGYTAYRMAIKMKLPDARNYIAFENAENVLSLDKLYRLYEISGDTPDQFLKRISQEVKRIQEVKEDKRT